MLHPNVSPKTSSNILQAQRWACCYYLLLNVAAYVWVQYLLTLALPHSDPQPKQAETLSTRLAYTIASTAQRNHNFAFIVFPSLAASSFNSLLKIFPLTLFGTSLIKRIPPLKCL